MTRADRVRLDPSTRGGGAFRLGANSLLVLIAIALAFLPFAMKRVALLGEPAFAYWLAWDYATRCFALVGVALAYRAGLVKPLPAPASFLLSGAVLTAAFLVERLQQLYIDPILERHLAYFHFASTPLIEDRSLLLADLFIGIWLVAISEEFVFRRLLFAVLERWALGRQTVLVVGAAIFGLVHVTTGLQDVASAFLHGLVIGAVFQATRRLSLCVALHYVDDFLIFGRAAADSGLWASPAS